MTGYGVPDLPLLPSHRTVRGTSLADDGPVWLVWQIVSSVLLGGGVIVTPDGE